MSGADGRIAGIVEETETDADTRGEPEVNAGLYAAEAAWLWPALDALEPGPRGERYLTDIIASRRGPPTGVEAFQVAEASEVQQVNTRVDLARAEELMRERIRSRLMLDGVTLVDPSSTYIDAGVRVAPDTTLLPGVHLLGDTVVGRAVASARTPCSATRASAWAAIIGASTLEGSSVGRRRHCRALLPLRPGSTVGGRCAPRQLRRGEGLAHRRADAGGALLVHRRRRDRR